MRISEKAFIKGTSNPEGRTVKHTVLYDCDMTSVYVYCGDHWDVYTKVLHNNGTYSYFFESFQKED
mgnify:CR=1 FL=1